MLTDLSEVPVFGDETNNDVFFDPAHGRGGEPRDYSVQPEEMFAAADQIPNVPKAEWDERIAEQDREQASLFHVVQRGNYGQPIPGLNQGQYGFCWGHSTAHAIMAARARANLPYTPLSAFGLVHLADPARAQNNRGGWCGLSAEAARTKGIPTQEAYPQGRVLASVSQEILDVALKFRVTEDFVDLTKPVWYQSLTFDKVASCLLTGRPCPVDFNWWGHSVCAVKLVRVEAGSYGLLIWNSWGPSWGENGFGILRGSKAIPDGAICVNSVKATAA